jgi:hypothetical protein
MMTLFGFVSATYIPQYNGAWLSRPIFFLKGIRGEAFLTVALELGCFRVGLRCRCCFFLDRIIKSVVYFGCFVRIVRFAEILIDLMIMQRV